MLPSRLARLAFTAALSVAALSATLPLRAAEPPPAAASADLVRPLLVGTTAPDAALQDADAKDVSLAALVKDTPTVIVFYRGGWCPYCTKQLAALAATKAELNELGFQLLAISPDTPANLKSTQEKAKSVDYTLLSDSKAEALRGFGVAYRVEDELYTKYKGKGLDLEAASGAEHHLLPVPAVFVLDRSGMIQFQYANPNYKVRLDPDVLLAAAKAALK